MPQLRPCSWDPDSFAAAADKDPEFSFVSVSRRPPLPVPRILKEGVSEAEVRTFADNATPIINKALCEPPLSFFIIDRSFTFHWR